MHHDQAVSLRCLCGDSSSPTLRNSTDFCLVCRLLPLRLGERKLRLHVPSFISHTFKVMKGHTKQLAYIRGAVPSSSGAFTSTKSFAFPLRSRCIRSTSPLLAAIFRVFCS